MDLKRLEALTHRALEMEATRRGIRDPQLRTHGELLRLILSQAGSKPLQRSLRGVAGAMATLEQARQAVGVVVDVAGSIFPTGLRSKEAPSATFATPAVAPATDRKRPPPADIMEAVDEVPEAAWQPRSHTEQAPPTPAAVLAASPAPPASIHVPLRAFTVEGPTTVPRRFVHEPIRTLSMARLLSAQGETERALSIYEELIARNSEDELARQEAKIVRRGGKPLGWNAPPPATREALPTSNTEDLLQWESTVADHARVRFRISDEGMARARTVLGCPGELTLRLVAIRPDPLAIVRSEIEDHGPLNTSGVFDVGPLDDETRWLVALGLRAGERFVAIAHGTRPT